MSKELIEKLMSLTFLSVFVNDLKSLLSNIDDTKGQNWSQHFHVLVKIKCSFLVVNQMKIVNQTRNTDINGLVVSRTTMMNATSILKLMKMLHALVL